MDCFAMQSFPPKEGMSWNKLIPFGTQNSESFTWPTELHILLYYGVMNILMWFSPEFPYKSEVKFFEKFRKYLELSLKTTSSWKSPLDLIKKGIS